MSPSKKISNLGNPTISQRADELFNENRSGICRRIDRMFAYLLVIQWIGGIVAAAWISPFTWEGASSETHLHVWAAVVLGGVTSLFPVYLVWARSGAVLTRHVIAVSQMLTSALLIHISGGRIETHFHIFGSLAFLACYRDWRVLVTATLVTSADHFFRGIFYPQSVFGVLSVTPWRVFEHAAWVLFEDVFLIITIKQSLTEMKAIANHQATLEKANRTVEATVESRTLQLQTAMIKSKANEQRIEAVVNSSQNPIITISSIGIIESYNPAAERNFGYSKSEVLGKNVNMLVPPPYRDEHDDYLRKCVAQGSFSILGSGREVLAQRKNGTTFPMHLAVSQLRIEGEEIRLTGTMRDLTDEKKAEYDLILAREAAEESNRSKSEFLANMSHEIRTPMTAILGFADILLNEDGLEFAPKQRVDSFRTIQRNGNYLLEIINDILDLSKIESNKIEIEQLEFSPCEILAGVLSLMQVRAMAKGLSLNLEYEGAIPHKIQSDPTRLRQILINLVGNAVKFTEVGSVVLKVRLLDADSPDPKLQMDVVDCGIGMTEKQIEKLFQPFVQADSSTTRKFGGTGLGLTISKRLAEMLGGTIQVYSTSGEGSTFSVTLPTGSLDGVNMIESPSEAGTLNLQEDRSAFQDIQLDCRVLLAEDGPDNQRLISFVLNKAGAEVTIAENGQIAHDLALAERDKGTPFDVILMDMQMPVLDGYGAAHQLREACYSGPIIALTAHAMTSDRKKCLDAGCNDYTTKPIDRMKLIELVHEYANSKCTDFHANLASVTQEKTNLTDNDTQQTKKSIS